MEKSQQLSKEKHSQLQVPKEVVDAQIGDYALLRDCPCRITEIRRPPPGKFGVKKAVFFGVDILTGKKCDDIKRETSQIEIPIFTVTKYQLVGISDDGYVSLLDDICQIKEDLTLPYENEELTQQIKNGYANNKDMQIEVTQTIGKQFITSLKAAP